jgi:hypothetical protein
MQVLFSYGRETEHVGMTTSVLALVEQKIKPLFIYLIFTIFYFRCGLR